VSAEVAVDPEGPVVLRRDAAENLGKVLGAARASFDQDGFDVGMEVIARRAGVGVGTIYRRFPTKADLIAAVVDEVVTEIRDAALAANSHPSPSDGFRGFLFAVGRVQFSHAGCLSKLWSAADASVVTEVEDLSRALLARAQAEGTIRDDIVYEDVAALFWSLQGVIERTAAVSPDAWMRHLELAVQSLTLARGSLERAPLTRAQHDEVKLAWGSHVAPSLAAVATPGD
jgi:AcrR family transcriptional regulator